MATRLRNHPPETGCPWVVETADDFRVHGRAYTDPEIFALEMDRVFGATWVYVAHESEIPNPCDFKTAYIGLRPVIVARATDGRINVLLNRCRHRGTVVCRAESGNAEFFSCKYHGWTYAADGALVSIPQRSGAYPDDFDKGQLGLMRAPRVASYRGLIFASLAPTGPSIIDHLGPARRYLDLHLDRSPVGEIALTHGIHRTEFQGNWKFQAENSTDGYHGNTVHESFWRVMAEFGNRGGLHGNYTETDYKEIIRRRETGCTRGFENGHGILEYPVARPVIERLRGPEFGDYIRRLEKTHGKAAIEHIFTQYNLWIFPNLGLLLDQIRVVRPIAPDRSEVTLQVYNLVGAPAAYNQERFDGYERFFGPASFGSPDDIEMFAMNQTGLQAKEVEWLLLFRGMRREQIDEHGERIGHPTDETPQRAFHRAWRRLMTA